MSAQLKLYNSTDFQNENVSEIRACPYSLDFKYTFKELKKDFYFRISYIAYCNNIEDEANYTPIGFSEDSNADTLTTQNYLINVNINSGFWEKSKDLLDGISKEFVVSYVAYKLQRGRISERNASYQIFLDLFIKFLNVVPYASSMTIFASRELPIGIVSKGLSSEIISQIQISFPSENIALEKNQVYVNQSKLLGVMHPVRFSSSSMMNKINWSTFSIFKAFFANVLNVNLIEPKKCAVFTFMSE